MTVTRERGSPVRRARGWEFKGMASGGMLSCMNGVEAWGTFSSALLSSEIRNCNGLSLTSVRGHHQAKGCDLR